MRKVFALSENEDDLDNIDDTLGPLNSVVVSDCIVSKNIYGVLATYYDLQQWTRDSIFGLC
jgi:hypothetical protein